MHLLIGWRLSFLPFLFVCMYVCIFTCMCMQCVCMWMWVHIPVCVCEYASVWVHICVCAHTCMCVNACTCMHEYLICRGQRQLGMLVLRPPLVWDSVSHWLELQQVDHARWPESSSKPPVSAPYLITPKVTITSTCCHIGLFFELWEVNSGCQTPAGTFTCWAIEPAHSIFLMWRLGHT